MNVCPRWLLVLGLSLTLPAAQAAGADKPVAATGSSKPTAALELAQTVTAVTGIAISPLLGVGAVGCYQYVKAPSADRGKLSWYAQPWFFVPALLVVGLLAAKDVLGVATPPGLKKPIDVAETLENKVSGLVATGAIVPMIGTFLRAAGPVTGLDPGPLHLAAVDLTPLLQIAATPFALAAYAVVWLAAHTVHVLILLSPWGVVDAVLKGIRTALLSALTGISLIDPWIGALLSVVLIVIAYFIAGWSFRLSRYGSVFCWDFFSLRRLRFKPSTGENWGFAARAMGEVPIRTYGRLRRTEAGKLEFAYRPWLFLAEKVHPLAEGSHAVGRALLHPTLETAAGDSHRTLFNFPPRYRGHEEELARAYGVPLLDVGLLGGLRAIGSGLRELVGLGSRGNAAS
jgi:hypothetical protein